MNNFNVIFYAAPSPMWVFDVNTLSILEVNKAAISFYGFTKEEFLSKTIVDLRPPEDATLIQDVLTQIKSTTTNFREFRHMDKKGKIFHVEVMSYPFVFNDAPARLVITQNIDERKAIAGQLEFTRTKLNKILESTSIGFLQTDHDSKITYWNHAAEQKIGYQREYVLGKDIWEVFSEAIDTEFYTCYQEAMQKRTNVELVYYYWPVQKWFSINIYPVVDGLIMHFRDISESKRYEERLVEKIEQLQEVSYLNSHFIRKPVASLLGLTNLITDNLVNKSEFKEIAAYIQECSVELDEIVRKINIRLHDEFSDSLFNEVTEFSLTELVKTIISDPKKNNRQVTFEADAEINFYGNKHSIEIAIDCLIDNAIKFSDSTKKIEVSLQLVAQNVLLTVKDYGIGIDKKKISEIFTDFGKKGVAKTLSTGLSKVSNVARRHNGNVWVESKPGKGSVFSMRLPISNMASFQKIGQTDIIDLEASGIEISYDNERSFISANWHGFHSLHSIKTGCLNILSTINKHSCNMVLNDNTNVMGTWDDAVEWVAREFFPMLQDTSLTHIAWVYSKSTFSRLSTDLTLETVIGNVTTKTFDDKETAAKWLLKMNNHTVNGSKTAKDPNSNHIPARPNNPADADC
jgi:PAS domain S-box-containing protein